MLWEVFLRKIEYFEGIIFLTTNLIHMIGKIHIESLAFALSLLIVCLQTLLSSHAYVISTLLQPYFAVDISINKQQELTEHV